MINSPERSVKNKPAPTGSMVQLPAASAPLLAEADVVVAGGGTAGFVAAIAAARTGARTLLVERNGYLGGALTGTYASQPGHFYDSEGHQIIRGIGWEFVQRMAEAGAAILEPDAWYAHIFPEAAKDVATHMVLEAGVELFLHTWMSEALVEQGRIRALVVQTKSGRAAICGRSFVDATGDADLASAAGARTEKLDRENLWQVSVDLTVCNVDAPRVVEWAQQHVERIGGWIEFPDDLGSPGVHPTFGLVVLDEDEEVSPLHSGPMPTVKLMIHPHVSRVQGSVEADGTDVRDLTFAQVEARRRALGHLEYLRRTVSGFEHAVVVGESPLGVRETRRIVGDYVLTLDDLRRNARFEDVVALNARPLDRHRKGGVFELEFLKGHHDIPLRSLLPLGVQNLVVAGRCISCDHDAHASLRGAATCLATGHAAGVAAALAACSGGLVRELDIARIQSALEAQGAILRV